VDDDEIIITGFRAGEVRWAELGGLGEEALEGIEPCPPVILGEVTPGKEAV